MWVKATGVYQSEGRGRIRRCGKVQQTQYLYTLEQD